MVVFIVVLHVVFFTGILIQGCKKEDTKPPETTEPVVSLDDIPPVENNSDYYKEYDPELLAPPAEGPDLNAGNNAQEPPPVQEPYIEPDPSQVQVGPATVPHTIARGDTFSGLSRRYNVSVKAIQDANPDVNPSRLRIGSTIEIPLSEPKAGSSAGNEAVDGDFYIVKKGDTLYQIALDHQTTVQAIQEANNLRTHRIFPDQKLRIPEPNSGR